MDAIRHSKRAPWVEKKVKRLPRQFIFMDFALKWARRSTCKRLRVGAIITDHKMRTVLGIGYNGPARRLPHDRCRADDPGRCGCIHAEMNAVSQVDAAIPDKIMFVTTMPCELCAQLIVQNNITTVYYGEDFREDIGRAILIRCSVELIEYTWWLDGVTHSDYQSAK